MSKARIAVTTAAWLCATAFAIMSLWVPAAISAGVFFVAGWPVIRPMLGFK